MANMSGDARNSSGNLMQKSVENLLLSSHEIIGSSISSSVSFNTMTLPVTLQQSHYTNPNGSLESRSGSPNVSPQTSPKPSPHQRHKRDHGRGENSVSHTKESSIDRQISTDGGEQDNISRSSDSGHILDLNTNRLHDSGSKDRKESRGSDKTRKKSSWYNVLYPTYKSRSEDFKRIFKDLPGEERLIVDYSCALQKDILVHGRLYVSQNYLCFYANIFRWETSVSIKWKDVTAITKEKTALVIPNAIQICTESEKHFFTSFGARDKTYLMLFRVWQNALMDQPVSMQEMWQWVHTCYGDELGLTSDDDDYVPPITEDDKPIDSKEGSGINIDLSMESLQNEECSGMMEHAQYQMEERIMEKRIISMEPSLEETHFTQENLRRSADHLPTDMSDTTESDAEKMTGKEKPPVCTTQHEGKEIVRTILPIHIDLLFTLLFTNSKFYLDFHTTRKTFDIIQSPWQQNAETGQKVRQLSFTVTLTQTMGPRHAQVAETQVMLPCSKPGYLYAIDTESVNSGIPYADAFYIAHHYCLKRLGENETCLIIYAQVKYKKSVWGIVKAVLTVEPDTRNSPEILSCVVLIVLLFLLLLNALLYYKLWSLEEWMQQPTKPLSIVDLHVLRNPPQTHEEWLHLLQHQETLHHVELSKWQHVLQAAIQLLRQTEESLSDLQQNIHSSVSQKVVAVLEETIPKEPAHVPPPEKPPPPKAKETPPEAPPLAKKEL